MFSIRICSTFVFPNNTSLPVFLILDTLICAEMNKAICSVHQNMPFNYFRPIQ